MGPSLTPMTHGMGRMAELWGLCKTALRGGYKTALRSSKRPQQPSSCTVAQTVLQCNAKIKWRKCSAPWAARNAAADSRLTSCCLSCCFLLQGPRPVQEVSGVG
jgi:hypothetical protein